MPRLAFALCFALLVLLPQNARSQVDEAGAERLKEALELAFRVANAAAPSQNGEPVGYLFDQIDVLPLGAAYSVTYNGMRYVSGGSEGYRVLFPELVFTMVPIEGGRFAGSSELPEEAFLVLDAEGGEIGQVTARNATMTGVFDPSLALNLSYAIEGEGMDMTFESGVVGSTGAFSLTANTIETQGLSETDQIGTGEVKDLRFAREGLETIVLERAWTEVNLTGFELEEYAATALKAVEAESGETFSPFSIFSFFGGDSSSMALGFEGLAVAGPAGGVTIGGVSLGGAYQRGEGYSFETGIEISLSALSLSPEALQSGGLDARLVPSDFTLLATLENLPSKEIAAYFDGFSNITNAGAAPEVLEAQIQEAALAVFGAVMARGSSVAIEELSLVTASSALAGTGSFRANAAAAFSADGFLRAEIAGVPQLQALAQDMAVSPDPQVAENGQGLLGILGLMMAYSQGPEAPAPSSPDALAFDLKLLPDGALLVNGLPVIPPAAQQ